jgi:tetratricopeptide (TPR) repeat protein
LPRWFKTMAATVLPLAAGALAWGTCAATGIDGNATGIIVGLVVLVPGTPLAIWAGQSESVPSRRGAPRPVPAVIGDVPREPRAFQPRPDLQNRVQEIFVRGRAATVCSLVGARGVGKTHLAAAYSRYCIDQGVPVAWLNAETSGQLSGSLELMAAELGLRSEADDAAAAVRKVRVWLEERREPYLVVLDNANEPDALAGLLPSRGKAQVLITTNDLVFERIAQVVAVERFTLEEALAYLRERVGRGDDATARVLVEELDNLPLALSIASAALVGPPHLAYDAYLARVRATSIDVLLDRPRGEPYPRGVAQAIMLSVGSTGDAAVGLLGELAVLSTAGVGLDLLGPEASPALSELGAASLVTFTRDGSTALVHRLVRRVIRDRAGRDGTLPSLLKTAAHRLEFVEGIADEDTWRRLPTIMAVSEHAAALWGYVEQLLDDDPSAARATAELVLGVRQSVAGHLLYLNDGVRAIPVALAVVEGRERILGPDHPDTLSAQYTLAHAHEYAGQTARAVELYEDLVAQRTRVLGDDARETLRTRAGLASALTTAGRADEAVELLDNVLAEQSRMQGADNRDLLVTRFFLAYALVVAERPVRAVDLFEALVADQERLLGVDHPETLVIRGRLAWAYLSAGQPDAAAETYEQVIASQERVLGVDHPDTLITGHGLASAYEATGRTTDALAQYQRVAERFEAVLGPDQTWTTTARRDQARVHQLLTGG